MNIPPKTLVKSRATLQALSSNSLLLAKYEAFDIIINYLWIRIKAHLINEQVERQYCIHIHNLYRYTNVVFTDVFISELIEVLKEEYPGVDFTYRETSGYDGNILERIIVMDWS
jgi:hypothetical protein